MSGIFLISDYEVIAENLKHYAISIDVYKELKEPILYAKGDVLIHCKEGILLFNNSKLKILYVQKEYRNKGIGSVLLAEMTSYLSKNNVFYSQALIPIGKLKFYELNGFKEVKRFVNYINVEKCWNN
jgi:GNAT superfamily N-acetyltransferase